MNTTLTTRHLSYDGHIEKNEQTKCVHCLNRVKPIEASLAINLHVRVFCLVLRHVLDEVIDHDDILDTIKYLCIVIVMRLSVFCWAIKLKTCEHAHTNDINHHQNGIVSLMSS